MLQVKDLQYTVCNQYGNKTKFVIHNVDFELEQGYMMGLLGKNGTGKSTLLRLLYGVLIPEQGSVTWKGQEADSPKSDYRQKVAYVGEENMFFVGKKIRENIEVLKDLYDDFQEELFLEYLQEFELQSAVTEKKLEELSTGQQKQVQLSFALARKPELLLLDEPAANLDPVFRMELMDILQSLIAREEISVLLSTHILEDVEDVADFLGVMDDGEMVLFGDRESLPLGKDTLRTLLQGEGKGNGKYEHNFGMGKKK